MKWKKSQGWLIPAILIVAAILIIIEQAINYGVVWEWAQVLHHENFSLILISLALGMLLSPKTQNKNEKNRDTKESQNQAKQI